MANVSTLVKSIQNIMRKDAGTYGDAQRLEQLGWMFFLKIFDDREKELDLLRDDYVSPLAPELRWCNWAADEEGKVRLVAGDRENYDDIVLNVNDIVSVYKVKGKLIINS